MTIKAQQGRDETKEEAKEEESRKRKRSHRGKYSLIAMKARLEPWALAAFESVADKGPRELRQRMEQTRLLSTLLQEKLDQAEAAESRN